MDIATTRRSLRRYEALLGPAAAALLGAAAAFFCLAMPGAIMARMVGAVGLSPPTGEARVALALGLGIALALATWLGFLWLDRPAKPRRLGTRNRQAKVAPTLRRADIHPDAPPRRPIFAGSDLGTPLDLVDPLPDDWEAPDANPVAPFATIGSIGSDTSERASEGPAPAVARPAAASVLPVVRVEKVAPQPPLAAMMTRLEAGLVRKALVLAGAEPNVTPMKREIRPVSGPLQAAVETLQQRTAARH